MHTALDTATRDRTLARYGARHHSRAYHVARSIIRAALTVIPFTLARANYAAEESDRASDRAHAIRAAI